MIKKTSPIMFRINKRNKARAKSHWFANKKDFSKGLIEDYKIRSFLESHPACSDLDDIIIDKNGARVQVTIKVPQVGAVIGKQGVEIDAIRAKLRKIAGESVVVEAKEVPNPNLSANIVAKNIAKQLESRVRANTAMREAEKTVRKAGALGFKVIISGRHGGADIARIEKRKSGCIPAQTIRQDIRYATARANTSHGVLGIKVWIALGDFSHSSKLENANNAGDYRSRSGSKFTKRKKVASKGNPNRKSNAG